MHIPHRPAACILTLCLLVMQAQVWASSVLGCRHEAGLATTTAVVCPMHQADAQQAQTQSDSLLDCQKCTLHCAMGVPALLTSAPMVPDLGASSAPVALAAHHFYRFRPGSPYRPPIS